MEYKDIEYWAKLINESESDYSDIDESGWSKPKLDIEILKRAIEKAKTIEDDNDSLPKEVFGTDIEFKNGSSDFNAVVKGRDVILQDGFYNGDNKELIDSWPHPIRWVADFKREPWTETINAFMLKVSKCYGEEADGDVLEWKVKSDHTYENDLNRYVISVSPYAIDWDNERIDTISNVYAGTVKPI